MVTPTRSATPTRSLLATCAAAIVALGGTSVASAAPSAASHGHGKPGQHSHSRAKGFDLQAHRGGLGLTTESSLLGFAKALKLGVTTLELDTQVTKDRKVVVSHDRVVSPVKCADTAPATPGDPQFPYVGKFVKDLTLAQIKTLDCGYQQLPGFPEQQVAAGAKMAELKDVFALVKAYGANKVILNIETKVEAGSPTETQPRGIFVRAVWKEIAKSGMARQVTHQSFDWAALKLMHKLAPRLPLVALISPDFLEVGKPGASPWLGGIDIDDFGGDPVAAAASIKGVTSLSPDNTMITAEAVSAKDGRRANSFVQRAHRRGLPVIPWTVNDPAVMNTLIDKGVDGIISDYPDRLRTVMAERGIRLPQSYRLPQR